MTEQRYRGAGGKKPTQPNIANDNLFSKDRVELLLAIGEGPIFGLEKGFKSFYAGEVPLISDDGTNTNNIPDLNNPPPAEYTGTAAPAVINFVLGAESASTSVGVEVLQRTAVIRYTPENLRGKTNHLEMRINFAQLYHQDSAGNVANHVAEFRIEYKSGRGTEPWTILDLSNIRPIVLTPPLSGGVSLTVATHTDSKNKYQLTGKTGGGFILDFRTDVTKLPDDDYQIRVTKFNPDNDPLAGAAKNVCNIVFDSFQVTDELTRSYANTAMVHVVGSASEQFSSIPEFYGIYKGLLTPVPSNYDPLLGTYTQPWYGTLTPPTWHNNPAWVLYDLLNNPRYGMRKYAPTLNLHTQDFYDVGVYCDQAVNNSFGSGLERRYTMNITLAENQNGWETLQNLAGSFDSVLYDDGEGTIRLKVDKWEEPRVLFTPETIQPEGFSYSFTDVTTWYNHITVSFTNPERGWQESRVVVKNDTWILENGETPLDFVAVGCTSESEATRRAKARLQTANTEKAIISFTTTRLGMILNPLEIVYVADSLLGWGFTGRIDKVRDLVIYLNEIPKMNFGDAAAITIQTEAGLFEGNVTSIQSDPLQQGVLLVTSNTTEFMALGLPDHAQFCLKDAAVNPQTTFGSPKPFRITAIEPVQEYMLYNVTALEVNPTKYDIINDGLNITIPIDTDQYSGINLRSLFNDREPIPRLYESVTFVFDGSQEKAADPTNGFLLICAPTVGDRAITVGDWTGILPMGVKPKLLFKGNVKIMGLGGAGGAGGYAFAQYYAPNVGGTYAEVWLGRGENGQDGGDSLYLDYPVEVQLEASANVEFLGGYGGGRGAEGIFITGGAPYASVPRVTDGFGNQIISMHHQTGYVKPSFAQLKKMTVPAIGGSGGWPFGASGASGASNSYARNGWTLFPDNGVGLHQIINSPTGTTGTKNSAGVKQTTQEYAFVSYVGVSQYETTPHTNIITSGVGAAGKPLSSLASSPIVSPSNPVGTGSTRVTLDSLSVITDGSQGIGVVNRGNLTIGTLGIGSVLTMNSDLYGYETFTG